MELDQPNSVTVPLKPGFGAWQQVVVPPLMNPREDVKGGWGILTPAALPPAMIVIVLPLDVNLFGKLPFKDCVPSEVRFHLFSFNCKSSWVKYSCTQTAEVALDQTTESFWGLG